MAAAVKVQGKLATHSWSKDKKSIKTVGKLPAICALLAHSAGSSSCSLQRALYKRAPSLADE